MADVIRSPQMSPRPHLLRTPALAATARLEAAADVPTPVDDSPQPDPELLARVADAEARAERAEAELDAQREDLDALREEARRTGHDAGQVEGAESARAELTDEIAQIGALRARLAARCEEELAHAEDAIAEAVLAAVCKLLGDALSTREGVLAAVRAVCEQVGHRDRLVLRLNPADCAVLAHWAEAEAELSRRVGEDGRIEPDASVELGGCIVESATGGLDGRLERQLDGLRRVLVETRNARRGGEA